MIRTVKWLSCALNIGKWLGLWAVALAYGRQKDAFLRELSRTSRWADLDNPSEFRNRDKKTRVNFWRLPVHLYDRALFDAVDIMRRWILSSIAQGHMRGKVFACGKLNARQKHYAFWILGRFERIGAAVNGVLADHPGAVVVEDLSHLRGRTKSRKLSRKVSRWMRHSLKERLEFKTQAGGSRLKIVNAAYTSQTCPACGWVDKGNRHGDRFSCVRCRFTAPADKVGAVNVKLRDTDQELRARIHPFTPKEQVKAILLEIYERSHAQALVTA